MHLAVADDVFDGVLSYAVPSHKMSGMRSGTELSQFLTLSYILFKVCM